MIEARTGLRSLGVVTWLERARDLPKEDILGLAELAPGGRAGATPRSRVAVPQAAAARQFRRSRPAGGRAGRRPARSGAGRAAAGATPISCSCPAARRRWATSPPCARRAGTSTSWPMSGAAAGCWACAAATRCSAAGSPIPHGLEGPPGEPRGLGLLEVDTVLTPAKVLALRDGAARSRTGEPVRGYEIHMGRTDGPGRTRPDAAARRRARDGAVSADGRVMGCYLHGLLAADGFRHALLAGIRGRGRPPPGLRGAGRGGAGRAGRASRAMPGPRPAAGAGALGQAVTSAARTATRASSHQTRQASAIAALDVRRA